MLSEDSLHIAFLNPQANFDPEDRYWTEHPDFGGQLVYVKEVALALGHMGHRVDILTRRIIDPEWKGFEAQFDSYPQTPNVRIVRLSCGGERFIGKEDLWPHLGTEWVPNIIAFYESEDHFPDIASAHYADGGLSGALMRQEKQIQFTFTGHSLGAQKMDKLGVDRQNWEEMESRFKFSRRLAAERVSMDNAARIITSTQQERSVQYGHRAYHGAVDPGDQARFSVIPPGVNLQVFSPDPSDDDDLIRAHIEKAIRRDIDQDRRELPLVIASSRLDKKKNHLGLVRAFARVAKLKEKANLAIVVRGLDDPLHDYQSLRENERNIMDQIVMTIDNHALWGCVTAFPLNSQAELAAAYRIAANRKSVFALTALYEPFGLAPLESMSCGLPAVVTRNGGPSESMIEGDREFGVLVDPGDPQDIAGGILRVLDTEASWRHFQESGMERVFNRYTWDRTAQGYLGVLKAIIEERPARTRLEIPAYFTHSDRAVLSPRSQLRHYFDS